MCGESKRRRFEGGWVHSHWGQTWLKNLKKVIRFIYPNLQSDAPSIVHHVIMYVWGYDEFGYFRWKVYILNWRSWSNPEVKTLDKFQDWLKTCNRWCIYFRQASSFSFIWFGFGRDARGVTGTLSKPVGSTSSLRMSLGTASTWPLSKLVLFLRTTKIYFSLQSTLCCEYRHQGQPCYLQLHATGVGPLTQGPRWSPLHTRGSKN